MELYSIVNQSVDFYPHLVQIKNKNNHVVLVENPDLWVASKINSTLKKIPPSQIYLEKLQLPVEKQRSFIENVRNHSWNRLHMGALAVASGDVEIFITSLASKALVLGKFYRIQQQTRRSVILDQVYLPNELKNRDDVKKNYQKRFQTYLDIGNARNRKIKGFDPYIQDAFKILPISTMTRIIGTWDLRTSLEYARWRELQYLPSSVQDFGQQLRNALDKAYPLFSQSMILSPKNTNIPEHQKQQLLLLKTLVKSEDLVNEPLLWYSDHSFLLPENPVFNQIYKKYKLQDVFKEPGPNAKFLGYYGPTDITTHDLVKLFENKQEHMKTKLELGYVAFASKLDLSAAIDSWRHTRNNRIVEPIYHAVKRTTDFPIPELYKRGKREETIQAAQTIHELSQETFELYQTLVEDGIPSKEAIHVLPHTFEIIQIEVMDFFSFLNLVALRTCTQARPEIQVWAKKLLQELNTHPSFKGITSLAEDGILARGIQYGYCMELGNCRKCGDIVYVEAPFKAL